MGLQLSGSVQLEGNLLVTGSANSVFENISVTNRITANEINVQFVSSSIIYSSGSNKFGDLITDTQQFTGSVDVSGSLTATTLVRRGGTSSQFLMADGSVNTNVLASGAYLPLTGGTLTGALNGTSATFSSSVSVKSPSTSTESFIARYSSNNVMLQLFELSSGTDLEFNLRNGAGTPVNRLSTNGNSFFNGGNVGINTATPNSKLEVAGNVAIGYTSAAPTNGMIVQGDVGIGTDNPTEKLQVDGSIRALQTSDTGIAQFVADASNTTSLRCGLATFGSTTVDDLLGVSRASNSFVYKNGGALAVGTGNAHPLYLSTSDTVRVTITSGGTVEIPGQITLGAAAGTLRIGTNAGDHTVLEYSGGATTLNTNWDSTSALLNLRANGVGLQINGNSEVFNAANTTTFNTTSDKRVKTNIVQLNNALNKIMALKPTIFDYTDDFANKRKILKSTNIVSFIADDYKDVFPDYVQESESVDFGIKNLKSIDLSPILPYLVKAIQEQQSQIEELKSKIELLENK